MTASRPDRPVGMDAVASRYVELWRALMFDGGLAREPAESALLLDQVRAALDRKNAELDVQSDARIIANSFIIDAIASEGARTQILRLRHRDIGTFHALKTLAPAHSRDAVLAGLLLREARLMLAVRHPNIVAAEVLLRLSDGRPALVMEWMNGSVAGLLQAGRALSSQQLRGFARDMLSGIAAIHAVGMVHADISPRNLLFSVGVSPTLKIADFGIALERGENHASLGLAEGGTPGFSEPDGPLDPAGDLRSCGRVLALMLECCSEEPACAIAELVDTLIRAPREMTARAALEILG